MAQPRARRRRSSHRTTAPWKARTSRSAVPARSTATPRATSGSRVGLRQRRRPRRRHRRDDGLRPRRPGRRLHGRLKVTNQYGFSDTTSTTVVVTNVAPTVTIGNDGPKAENTAVTVSVSSATPAGSRRRSPRRSTGATAQLPRPVGNGRGGQAVQDDHVLGAAHVRRQRDFTVTVCAADDDTTNNLHTTQVTVTNVDPTAVIDLTGTTHQRRGHVRRARGAGDPVHGLLFDPGSDDRTTTWAGVTAPVAGHVDPVAERHPVRPGSSEPGHPVPEPVDQPADGDGPGAARVLGGVLLHRSRSERGRRRRQRPTRSRSSSRATRAAAGRRLLADVRTGRGRPLSARNGGSATWRSPGS